MPRSNSLSSDLPVRCPYAEEYLDHTHHGYLPYDSLGGDPPSQMGAI